MALVIAALDLTAQLEAIRTGYLGSSSKLKLFTNNHTPAVADTIASYTEATFGGYAEIALDAWAAATYAAGVATILETLRIWTYSGTPTNVIYGYYVTNSGGTQLRWAELAAGGPYTINTVGQILAVQPRYTFQNQ